MNGEFLNSGGSHGLKLPKIPEFASHIKDAVNIGYASFSSIPIGIWTLENLSLFDKVILGLDVGLDIYDSMQSEVSFGGTVVGTGLMLAKGVGMIYASKGIILTFISVGSMFGPVCTVVGFIIAVGVTIYFDYKVGKWLDEQIGKLKRLI